MFRREAHKGHAEAGRIHHDGPAGEGIDGHAAGPLALCVLAADQLPLDEEPPVEIRVIEGAPVPAAVGGPADEPDADEPADDDTPVE